MADEPIGAAGEKPEPFSVRLTASERAELQRWAERDEKPLARWIVQVALRNAERLRRHIPNANTPATPACPTCGSLGKPIGMSKADQAPKSGRVAK